MAVRSVVFDIIGKDRASSSFKKIGFAAESAAAKIEAAANRSIVAGRKLTKGLTVPIAAAVAVAIDQSAKYQKSLTLLQTAGGELQKNMGVVSDGIKRIAVQTGTSLGDLTEGMYTVEKAGIRGASGIKVLHAAAEGAKAENVDLGTATNALTSILMSYGLHASAAVRVQNELVAGAGQAKTTMQEYAASLSTVIPLAARAGISFPQIAGAIATLTQHGTAPAEATQELAFAIRNLQAPSQQAMKAMNMLGIDVNDLETNLGKRGLTGTLNLVEDALAHHMKGGLVVVDTFKQAQNATANLAVELKAMPPNLRAISEQFDKGKLGYKDYYTDVKTMGGQLFQLGKGFISTESQAKGFNTLLTSGQPAQRTAAATLKQLMGGANGLNVALQLGGTSAKYFAGATARVNDEGKKAGKNISTWAMTQKTAAVQADKLREKLQVLAVNLGDRLLPLVVNAVKFFAGLIDKFTSLPKGVQSTIVKVLLLSAILGPLLVLVGKLTRALLLMWATTLATGRFIAGVRGAELALTSMGSKAYLAGLKVRAAMIGMGGASKVAGTAVAGLAIGAIGGLLVRNSDNATKAVGGLTSVAAGAATGLAMGGPLGAAIGGVTAGLGFLATAFTGAGQSAKAAIKPTEEYTSALQQDRDAIGKVTAALVAQNLQQRGLYDAGLKLGISQRTLLRAALGHADALQQVDAAIIRTGYGYGKFNANAAKLSDGLGIVGQELKVNQRAAINIDSSLGHVSATLVKAGINVNSLGAALEKSSHMGGDAHKMLAAVDKALGLTGLSADKFGAKLIDLAKKGQITDQQLFTLTSLGQLDKNTTQVLYDLLQVHGALTSLPTQWNLKLGADPSGAITGAAAAQHAVDSLRGGTVVLNADARGIGDAILAAENALSFLTGTRKSLPQSIIAGLNKTYGGQSHLNDPIGDFGGAPDTSSGGGGSTGTKAKPPKFSTSTLDTLRHSLSGTASSIRSAIHSIVESLRNAKDAVPAFIATDAAQLEKLARNRTSVAKQLDKANSALQKVQSKYRDLLSSVKSAVTGSFDITTAGANAQVFNDRAAAPTTSRSILRDLDQKVAAADKFETVLKKLKAEGMPPALIQELALAGPAALAQAQALAKSTPAQIARYRSDYKQLSNVGTELGKFIAKDTYGAGVKAAHGLVDGLKSKQSLLNKAIKDLGKSMIAELLKTLKAGSHHHAGGGNDGGRGSAAELHTHYHAHGIQDPTGFLVAARRREQMLSV